MAIGDKPASQPQWADGGSAQITEPSSGKKTLGWVKEKPSFAFFNWFWNLVYQWIAWAKKYGEEHVHDGGSTDWSAPKISLLSHIDWGDNGEMEVIDDTVSVHEVEHNHTGAGVAKFNTDVLGLTYARFGKTTGEQFDLQDLSGLAGARAPQFIGVDGDPTAVYASAFRPALSNSPGGDMGTLAAEDTALYLGNLAKVVGKFNFTESGGTVSNSPIKRYNIPGNWVTSGAPAGTYLLTVSSAGSVDGVVTVGASVDQAGSDTNQYKADIDWDASNGRLVLRLYYFDSTTNDWLNVRVSGPPTGMDMNVQLVVY